MLDNGGNRYFSRNYAFYNFKNIIYGLWRIAYWEGGYKFILK